jgi:hypothetical protein
VREERLGERRELRYLTDLDYLPKYSHRSHSTEDMSAGRPSRPDRGTKPQTRHALFVTEAGAPIG